MERALAVFSVLRLGEFEPYLTGAAHSHGGGLGGDHGVKRPDVIVVGAGPAGAATAILLCERGLDVLVLDRARFPRPKLCGEYLSPESARLLDRLGVLKAIDAAGAASLQGMRITAPDGTVLEARYRTLDGRRPYRGHAMALSRSALDAILVDRLRVSPAEVREGVRVTDLVVEGDRVIGVETLDGAGRRETIAAPLVIGADGRASVVAHRLGCRRAHSLQRMALVTYVAGVADCRDVGEIFVDPPDYAILNPLAPDRVNMSLVVPLEHVGPWRGRLPTFFASRVKQLVHLARRLDGAECVAPIEAMGPLAYRVDEPAHGGVLLVGDAAGFYDPLTGEGVFSALRGAELAAEAAGRALARGDVSAAGLAEYSRARREAFADKQRFTRALQFVVARRRLGNLVAHHLGRRQDLLDLTLGVVGDFVPPRSLLRRALLGRR
jgi:geranylgeranyl reductase family protein